MCQHIKQGGGVVLHVHEFVNDGNIVNSKPWGLMMVDLAAECGLSK